MAPSLDPDRRRLLARLDAYLGRYPDEQAASDRIRGLVEAHERCFHRDCFPGHITGSAWIVNRAATHALLTHHRKLGRWLQLGGHSDGEGDTRSVAQREGQEESGLRLELLDAAIFDIDVHDIPARGNEPAHEHHDLRFLFRADTESSFVVSEESHDLAWVPMEQLEDYTDEWSVLRLAHKFLNQRSKLV
ncbi:MAG: NUDIX hydrolase [Pseudomonadota bacterium]